MFLFAKNSTLCNYADDHAQCSIEKKIDQIMSNLQTDFHKPKVWFYHYVLLRIGCGSLFSGVKRTYQILKMR